METKTETSANNRELTTTEIKIAIAQIEDRMSRIAQAQEELGSYEGDNEKEKIKEIREKFSIPENVFIFDPNCDSALLRSDLNLVKKYISPFVRGQMADDQFDEFQVSLHEIYECDYGWIFMETPIDFYSGKSAVDNLKIFSELKSIATRSTSKIKHFPPSDPLVKGYINRKKLFI